MKTRSETAFMNLRKLADYLMAIPADYQNFSMHAYAEDSEGYDLSPTEVLLHDCGTVACALGHAPAAGIPALPSENWYEYGLRAFELDHEETLWCFGGCWCGVDNSSAGAALRIYWLLDHGLPKNWRAQSAGSEPLCY